MLVPASNAPLMFAGYTIVMHHRDEPIDHSLDLEAPLGDQSRGWGIHIDPDGEVIQGPDPEEEPESEPYPRNRQV